MKSFSIKFVIIGHIEVDYFFNKKHFNNKYLIIPSIKYGRYHQSSNRTRPKTYYYNKMRNRLNKNTTNEVQPTFYFAQSNVSPRKFSSVKTISSKKLSLRNLKTINVPAIENKLYHTITGLMLQCIVLMSA